MAKTTAKVSLTVVLTFHQFAKDCHATSGKWELAPTPALLLLTSMKNCSVWFQQAIHSLATNAMCFEQRSAWLSSLWGEQPIVPNQSEFGRQHNPLSTKSHRRDRVHLCHQSLRLLIKEGTLHTLSWQRMGMAWLFCVL